MRLFPSDNFFVTCIICIPCVPFVAIHAKCHDVCFLCTELNPTSFQMVEVIIVVAVVILIVVIVVGVVILFGAKKRKQQFNKLKVTSLQGRTCG